MEGMIKVLLACNVDEDDSHSKLLIILFIPSFIALDLILKHLHD